MARFPFVGRRTILFTLLALGGAHATYAGDDLVVGDGMKVSIEYDLSLADKTKVGSNVGDTPFSYVQGQQQVVPGLEKGLSGLKAGERKRLEVPASEGYGPYDEKARVTVKKSQVPGDVQVGSLLSTPEGRPVKVVEVKEEDVVLDLNHPLAGKDLVFEVKVVKVEESEPVPEPQP